MKFSATTSAIAVAIIALAGTAHAADYSANIELDNTLRSGSLTKDTTNAGLTQGGRVEFNASGKAGKDVTVSGRASFLAQKTGGVATDDMWISVNSASGSGLKLGRFEAFDMFPISQDTVVNDAGSIYKTNLLRGRKGDNQFHAAGTLALGGGLALELGLVETKVVGAAKGFRPVVSYANGPLSLAAGLESGKILTAISPAASDKFTGFGLTGAYDFGGFKLTGDFANATIKSATELKKNAFGLNALVGPFFAGVVVGNNKLAGNPTEKITTLHASYKMPLFDIKNAFVTPAFSTSKATNSGNVNGASLKDNSIRVRLNYEF